MGLNLRFPFSAGFAQGYSDLIPTIQEHAEV
jgi:hypothetical protein